MFILSNIFVELEHFILFNNVDKYHNFIYYRINITLMVHRQFMSRYVIMLQVLHIIFNNQYQQLLGLHWNMFSMQ